jgi:SAM-dependent methyltransferase
MTDHFEPEGLRSWLRRLPRYQYLADLIVDRQVLELGCGSGYGTRFLADLGAKHVIGLDPSAERIREARAQHRLTAVEFRVGDAGQLEVDDQSVDLVLIPDGAGILRRPAALEEIRRVLQPTGSLMLAARSADRKNGRGGVSYHEFMDRLGPLFAPVRMIAHSPFIGMALVEYAADDLTDPAADLDTSLLELTDRVDDDITDYIALCGGEAREPRPYTIVQVPPGPGVEAAAASLGLELVGTAARDDRAAARLAEALARVSELEDRVERGLSGGRGGAEDDLRRRLTRVLQERDALNKQVEVLQGEVEEAEQQIGRVAAEAGMELNKARNEALVLRERVLELEAQLARGPAAIAAGSEPGGVGPAAGRDSAAFEPAGRVPSVSERIADAMVEHAAEMRALEMQLEERSACAEELGDERDAAVAQARQANEQLGELRELVAALRDQLSQWRSRASIAEGQLLKQSLAAAQGVAEAPATAGDDNVRPDLSRAYREIEALKAQLEWSEDGPGSRLAQVSERLRALEDSISAEQGALDAIDRELAALRSRAATPQAAALDGERAGGWCPGSHVA